MSPNAFEEEPLSRPGCGEALSDVVARYLSRRALLRGGLVLAATLAAPALRPPAPVAARAPRLDFEPLAPGTSDTVEVARGYRAVPLLRWGDPLTADAPEFDPSGQTPEAQARQFGYNCDFVGFLPLPPGSNNSNRGLLVVNHEYTNPELMFAGYDPDNPTRQQVDVELAAHGMTVVEVQQGAHGRWAVDRSSPYNRRITATTPMLVAGPVAGHDWLKTNADPTGTRVLGTLNNCAGGKTPWGTVLSAEENFHQYFASLDAVPDADPRKAVHRRYGLPGGASERKWERFYDRFDLAQEPNEPFRFGWVVEIDPYDPAWTPRKRTALGRFKREAATVVVTRRRQVVVYSGDDERFEYVYKFVSARPYQPGGREANRDLLDEGTLYVARFHDDGSGEWLPLVFGQGPLTPANGFASQAEVLLNPRGAADLLGATKMDRPEDIETNPVNGRVYLVMTNNTQRGATGRPGPDGANPRANNRAGHIIELVEDGDDHASTTFTWQVFMLCGDPSDPSTYFAGYPKDQVSPIAAPDNVTFDLSGNLWIATDGMPGVLSLNDGLYVVPVEGPERGHLRLFLTGVRGAEVCGPEFTPNNTTLFVAIQHPGEGGTVAEPVSRWPDGTNVPRPSVLVVQSEAGGRVGLASPTRGGK
ncbi:MAG TPA: PhoX family phosphatase [Chloroflexota bacterium]